MKNSRGSNQDYLFDLPPIPEKRFNIFHDESGKYNKNIRDRWLVHGLVIIPSEKQSFVYSELQKERKNKKFYSEIHFVNLGKSTRGPKAECSKSWINLALTQFADFTYYYFLAVDTQSQGFNHERFAEPFHVYNYFAKVAIVSAISWCLYQFKRISIQIYSDFKNRPQNDNFSEYLPMAVLNSIENKRNIDPGKYPEMRLISNTVIPITSNPMSCPLGQKEACEVIQLTDLFTSNINQVLSASSSREAKIQLALMLSKWIVDVRKPPWLQNEDLHRIFKLSCFPDQFGNFYDPKLRIEDVNQLPLFTDNE
jgi:hypothetical protein